MSKNQHISHLLTKNYMSYSEIIPNSNSVKYLGLILDSKLTWKVHIDTKCNQINSKYKRMYWLIGRKSQLALKKQNTYSNL